MLDFDKIENADMSILRSRISVIVHHDQGTDALRCLSVLPGTIEEQVFEETLR